MAESKKKLLFVCLGNICRSPAADGVMRKKSAEAGLEVEIESSGIGGWHVGQLPDRRMRECGAKRGYTFDHRARQVRVEDFGYYDMILGMDSNNITDLKDLAPTEASKKKICCLADYMTSHPGQQTIPDPYYGSERDFEYALDLIEDAIEGLISSLSHT